SATTAAMMTYDRLLPVRAISPAAIGCPPIRPPVQHTTTAGVDACGARTTFGADIGACTFRHGCDVVIDPRTVAAGCRLGHTAGRPVQAKSSPAQVVSPKFGINPKVTDFMAR